MGVAEKEGGVWKKNQVLAVIAGLVDTKVWNESKVKISAGIAASDKMVKNSQVLGAKAGGYESTQIFYKY